MRPLLEAQIVPFELADSVLLRANPDASHSPLFVPHVLDPEGRVLDEKALEPFVMGPPVIRPHPELNSLDPSPLNRKDPGRHIAKFSCKELVYLLRGPRDCQVIPAVVGHPGKNKKRFFMPS